MKITIAQLLKVLHVMNVIAAPATTKDGKEIPRQYPIPTRAAYRIARNINMAVREAEIYERERVKLAQELSGGVMTEDKTAFVFAGDAKERFDQEHAKLLSEEVEIGFVTLSPEDFGDAKIDVPLLMVLDGVIVVEDTPTGAA